MNKKIMGENDKQQLELTPLDERVVPGQDLEGRATGR